MDLFLSACETGDIAAVNRYLSYDNTELNFSEGLYCACRGKQIQVVKLLFNSGIMIETRHFVMACAQGSLKLVKFLIKNSSGDLNLESGLEMALITEHENVIKFLLKKHVYTESDIDYMLKINLFKPIKLILKDIRDLDTLGLMLGHVLNQKMRQLIKILLKQMISEKILVDEISTEEVTYLIEIGCERQLKKIMPESISKYKIRTVHTKRILIKDVKLELGKYINF
jgi:hypothetical protein